MQAIDEENLVADWITRHGLRVERFTKDERRSGKTPDFRVYRGADLVAYAEVKSTRDDRLDDALKTAAPGEIVGGVMSDSVFNRLARHIVTAAGQFDAVNPNRSVPNILAYVNHDEASGPHDLASTLTGNFYAEGGSVHPIHKSVSEGETPTDIGKRLRGIDLSWLRDWR